MLSKWGPQCSKLFEFHCPSHKRQTFLCWGPLYLEICRGKAQINGKSIGMVFLDSSLTSIHRVISLFYAKALRALHLASFLKLCYFSLFVMLLENSIFSWGGCVFGWLQFAQTKIHVQLQHTSQQLGGLPDIPDLQGSMASELLVAASQVLPAGHCCRVVRSIHHSPWPCQISFLSDHNSSPCGNGRVRNQKKSFCSILGLALNQLRDQLLTASGCRSGETISGEMLRLAEWIHSFCNHLLSNFFVFLQQRWLQGNKHVQGGCSTRRRMKHFVQALQGKDMWNSIRERLCLREIDVFWLQWSWSLAACSSSLLTDCDEAGLEVSFQFRTATSQTDFATACRWNCENSSNMSANPSREHHHLKLCTGLGPFGFSATRQAYQQSLFRIFWYSRRYRFSETIYPPTRHEWRLWSMDTWRRDEVDHESH